MVHRHGNEPLEYPPGEKKAHVTALGLTGGWVYRLSAVTDVGVAAGSMRFSGSTAKSFSKFITDFYTVIRPLSTLGSRWDQALEVRLEASWFPQGFTLDDFGATSGSLNGKTELMTQFGINLNLYNLVWSWRD
jgi:hypothetical protein